MKFDKKGVVIILMSTIIISQILYQLDYAFVKDTIYLVLKQKKRT